MATVTLSELREAVRNRGDYQNTLVFTTTILNGYINSALAELYDVLVSTWADYYTTETTLSTVAAQAYVDLPAGFYKLAGLDRLVSGSTYERVRLMTIADRNAYPERGEPIRYRLQSGGTTGRLILYPTPAAVYTLRLYYIPALTKLTADGDTFEMINGYEELPIQMALLRCRQRDEQPTGDIEREIMRLMDRVRSAADTRDVAEPDYLHAPWSNAGLEVIV